METATNTAMQIALACPVVALVQPRVNVLEHAKLRVPKRAEVAGVR
jgi:hypothetical protein